MSYRDLTPVNPGESIREYDLTISPTSSTSAVATAALTFDRPYLSAPSIASARISGSTFGRLAIVGADTPTTSGLTGFINPNGNNIEGSYTVKVIVCGQLA